MDKQKLAASSLGEVDAAIREFCVEENGEVMLNIAAIRTQKDVDALAEAKRKEVADHNATKTKLAAWRGLGFDTPELLQARLSELESQAGDESLQTQKIAKLLKENRALLNERDSFQQELESIKPAFETQKKQLRQTKIYDLIEGSVKKLKGVDEQRLIRSLRKDVLTGFIDLDESEDGLQVKTGERFEEYAMNQARDFKFFVPNTPGESQSTDSEINRIMQNNADTNGYLDDDLIEELKK